MCFSQTAQFWMNPLPVYSRSERFSSNQVFLGIGMGILSWSSVLGRGEGVEFQSQSVENSGMVEVNSARLLRASYSGEGTKLPGRRPARLADCLRGSDGDQTPMPSLLRPVFPLPHHCRSRLTRMNPRLGRKEVQRRKSQLRI